MPVLQTCSRCGYISSAELCKACVMLEGLNRGKPEVSIGKHARRKKILKMTGNSDTNSNCKDRKIKCKNFESGCNNEAEECSSLKSECEANYSDPADVKSGCDSTGMIEHLF